MRWLGALLLAVAPVTLSDLDKAQAANHQLAVQLLGCQEQLASAQVTLQKAHLTEAQATLEARFREVLKPPDGATFNWQTLTFDPPAPAEKK